jgi:PAS domain S-box-containing protein
MKAVRKPKTPRVVAATLVTVTTILLGGFGAVAYATRSRDELARLDRVTNAQADELAVALALPIWNFDHPQIDKILDSQERVTPIEGIVVLSAHPIHARVRDGQRRFVRSDGRFTTGGLLLAQRPVIFDDKQIGTVKLYTTTKLIEKQLRAELGSTVTAILTTNLLLILFVYFLLWRNVLRPIGEIEQYAGAVSGATAGHIPTLMPAPTAELESLRVSIESMVRQLAERYAELQEHMAGRIENEERFRTIFQSVNDVIMIFDPESGAILDVNDRFCALLGYTREEALLGSSGSFASNVGPYRKEVAVAGIRDLREDDHLVREWQARRKDGEVVDFEVSLRLATIGGARRVITVARDITRRKEMEATLRRSETMSAMGSLVAGVAHEVRNPLFGMSAMLDAYAEEMTTPDLQELSGNLRQQITRLTQLMRELLEYGRPVHIRPVPDSLANLVEQVLASRAKDASSTGVELRSAINGSVPLVLMDRSRLRQVFENLVDNALQHAPAVRSVAVTAAAVEHMDRAWIECRVEDDGNGFAEEDLARVFEPFFTRREKGIGLGMSIVQRIVEEHGGRVTVGNHANGGAVITVRLPAV